MKTINHPISVLQPSRLLIILLALHLVSCQANPPVLQREVKPDNKMENPKYATQVPDKLQNVNERDAKIYDLIQQINEAWDKEDFASLERLYQELDTYDPGNLRVAEGVRRLQMAQYHQVLLQDARTLSGKGENEQAEAIGKLRRILQENPQHQTALELYAKLIQKQEEFQRERTNKKLAYNEPVTMEFRDVNLKQVFESLSRTAKINFILDKDIPSDQKVTLFVKNMLFRDALDLLLQTNQLEKKVLSDNAVIIYVNDIMHQRDYKDLSVRSFSLDYADAKQMSGMLKNILGVRQVEVDARLNTLIIKDSPEVLNIAEKMILAQDLPDPEVMLEMQVMEVKTSSLRNLGVVPPTGVSVPVPDSKILTVHDLTHVTGNSLVVGGVPGIQFNETNGDVNLLANPRIRVKNRDVARIHIGEKVPVFTANVASTGVASQSVQYIDAGLKLEVEPQISTAGDVTIKLSLNVGSIGEKVVAASGNSESVAFRIGTRLAQTQLRLHDGETQVLAGLIDDQDRKNISGLPGLSKLPILGRLFGTHADDKSKTEIVLSITPHIVRERRYQTNDQADMWLGAEGRAGKSSSSPGFGAGAAALLLPRAANPNASATPVPTNTAPPRPENINIPLPPGFSLGNGLPQNKENQ